jgi:hypothetical protein
MAVQPSDKKRKPGAQILRTPAPDELTQIRNPQGGTGYGQNAPQPSSVAPGKAVESAMASNLRESQVADTSEDVLSEVIAKGVAGRGDTIPADGDYDDAGGQLRRVSSQMYPPSHGMVRQQNPDAVFGKGSSLPSNEADDEAEPVRQP